MKSAWGAQFLTARVKIKPLIFWSDEICTSQEFYIPLKFWDREIALVFGFAVARVAVKVVAILNYGNFKTAIKLRWQQSCR